MFLCEYVLLKYPNIWVEAFLHTMYILKVIESSLLGFRQTELTHLYVLFDLLHVQQRLYIFYGIC